MRAQGDGRSSSVAHVYHLCITRGSDRVSLAGTEEQENAVRLLGSGTTWKAELQRQPKTLCGHSYAEHLLNTISVQKMFSLCEPQWDNSCLLG